MLPISSVAVSNVEILNHEALSLLPSKLAPSVNHATSRHFKTTQWQIVTSAGEGADRSLADLCQAYWKPLYFYVRRQGYSPEDSQDLIQSFMVHLLTGQLLSSADPARGKFRTFLLTSLRRFAINQWKRQTAAKRGGGTSTLRFDFYEAEAEVDVSPWHDMTPDRVYERKWAIEVLQQAIRGLESDLAVQGKRELFQILLPNLTCQADAPAYRHLETSTGMTSDALKMTVSRWRKLLGKQIRECLKGLAQSDDDLDREISELFNAL